MGHRTYDDFDLRISTEGTRYRVRAPKAGKAQQFDLDAEALSKRAKRLAEAFEGVGALEPEELREARALGGDLFQAIFPREVFAAWKEALPRPGQKNRGLRLRLHVEEAGPLAALPWELLYHDGSFLALGAKTSVLRHPEFTESPRELAVDPPLRLLMVLPNPRGRAGGLDVRGELRAIEEELAPLVGRGLVVLETLGEQTITALEDRLRREPPVHALHFAGHGELCPEFEDARVWLERKGGGRLPEPLFGHVLAALCREAEDLRLVVVNACEGAGATGTDPPESLALRLLQHGIPAVVALQTPLADEPAQVFARTLYRVIAEGRSLEESVAAARMSLHSGAFGLAWATPVLFLRASNGDLLKLPPESLGTADVTPVTPQRQPWMLLSIFAVLALSALVLWQSLTSKPRKALRPGPPPSTASDPACPSPRGLEFAFRRVGPGDSEMGAPSGSGDPTEERPLHPVRITKPYCVSAFEVTVAQWDAVMSGGKAGIKPGIDLPKVGTSWEDAQRFVRKLRLRDPTGRYRLPTEAEWEYATRAGSWAAFAFGEQAEDLAENGNCMGEDDGFPGLAPVGSLRPNRFELYDFHGNAQEWVADWFGLYAPTKEPEIDPLGPKQGTERVRRGGSYEMKAENCASWSRRHSRPDRRGNDFGFRIARSPTGGASYRGESTGPAEPAAPAAGGGGPGAGR